MKEIEYDNIITIDYVMKLERENRNLKKDSEAAELFYYLLKHFSYRSYNPKGNYCVVAFTIYDENKNEQLTKFLHKQLHEFLKNKVMK